MENILSSENIDTLANYLKKQHKMIVLTGGCFDILHVGHIALLNQAKKQGDLLIVFVESDQTITSKKGTGRPLHTQEQRAQVLMALKVVDYVVLLKPHMADKDYDQLVKSIQPDIIAATENDPGLEHKKRQAQEVGAKLVFVTKVIKNISTSRIISQLEKEL